MEIVLPDWVRMLAQEVRRFVEQEVNPRNVEIEESERIPEDLMQKTREMGLFGLSIPQEYGGIGLNVTNRCAIEEELGRGNWGLASVIAGHSGIGTTGIVYFGTDRQKDRFLPRMANGEILAGFALTEPQAGSDAAAIRTRAVRDGDDWVLNGEKVFIGNSPIAGVMTVMAVTNPGKGGKGISSFLVESPRPGLIIGPPEHKMGMKGALSATVTFQDCQVPGDALLGVEGEGFVQALRILSRGRTTMSARCVGMATKLLELATEYARNRVQFGQPIADFQGIRWMLADMATEIHAARLMVYNTAALIDRGEKAIKEVAMTKLFVTEMVGRVADRAVQIHGGYGYILGYDVERLYRDARVTRIYEGTSEIQRNVIAARLLQE